ncbi:hypothetical protein B0T20DRAFT_136312 [Sordaria brevicollis]|uniref:Uncharacterized protein n=1 Tax=Sordaria brevicollis TaxID=83679 RepID=A0AAE0PLV8_SORBR|nr:hypothetical protein B0T20DRAFT_136312 [Sordaria brevicollis]
MIPTRRIIGPFPPRSLSLIGPLVAITTFLQTDSNSARAERQQGVQTGREEKKSQHHHFPIPQETSPSSSAPRFQCYPNRGKLPSSLSSEKATTSKGSIQEICNFQNFLSASRRYPQKPQPVVLFVVFTFHASSLKRPEEPRRNEPSGPKSLRSELSPKDFDFLATISQGRHWTACRGDRSLLRGDGTTNVTGVRVNISQFFK